jgi:carboxylesterase type B
MVVSTNYRTSALGFLSSAEVKASGEENFGSYDQRLALNWVQENIKAFGGAPDKVTIWGERCAVFSFLSFDLTEANPSLLAVLVASPSASNSSATVSPTRPSSVAPSFSQELPHSLPPPAPTSTKPPLMRSSTAPDAPLPPTSSTAFAG